ncbi:ras and EF-hand domain-containing protein isoform X2 [Nelusetta ayraudi]|uniref:ras and EF-hand domain-containing protein isoform X2 n=1 Tax=Nelusetta ayraudi TaxID=303726 RepID=UPI003F71F82F
MERPSLRRLFSACDVNKSGRIEYEDFTAVCRGLSVPEEQIATLFGKFDTDEDGFIDYRKFSSRFQEFSESLDLTALGTEPPGPWEEFVGGSDVDRLISERLREQLADLYQAIHSSANRALLQQYEEVVHSLLSHVRENRQECERMETSLMRAEEMNSSHLTELEEDIQQQLSRTEERVRQEEQKKTEEILANVQRKHENKVSDLQTTVDRLIKSQKESEFRRSQEEVIRLNRQIRELSQENEQLRSSLMQAHTDISVLHSELDKLKNLYLDQKELHERETEDLRKMLAECQSYSSQIQILQETNRKLYDSNDGLRSALAGAAKRRLSPQNEIPARRMKPLRQSTLKCSSLAPELGKTTYCDVSSWADTYLDSGVSMAMDTADSTASDYDSDNSRSSTETVHRSFSCVPSDVEVRVDITEAAVLGLPTRGSSIASSVRRRLSAFSSKHLDPDPEETEGPAPMYRLVLAGDAGAGKSSFLLRLTNNEFKGDIQTTLGVDFQVKRMLVDGEKTNLQIWDTAGQERFRSIARSYFRKAHGVLLLYDVTSESSFLNMRAWVDQIQDSAEDKISICVVGNKVDLREQHPEGTCVSSLHGEKLAKTYGALFCETSAKDGTNVVEAVLHLAREVKKNAKLRRQSDSEVTLSPSNSKKSFSTCCRL